MELDFTEDQEALRASVRAVLERECPIGLVRGIVERGDRTGAVAPLWKRMVDLDWPALTVPEAAGGVGLGFVELAVLAEEAGRVIAPGPLLPTISQFVPAVRETATPEQAGLLLGRVADGSLTGTLALDEGAGAWDPGAGATTAERDGDGWVLRGHKRFVVEASSVDAIAVVATTGGGLSVVVVPAAAVTITPLPAIDQSRELAAVDLDGVRVDDGEGAGLLGEPGRAAEPLRRALDEATVAMALETVGTCQTIFDTALDHAKARHQFGVPIGSFQAVKHKLVNMYVALERARATCYFAAATIAEDDERRALAASMAKAAAGDCQRLVAQDGIQLLGGIGYTWEHDMQLYVKRAKANEALFGTAAAHRRKVADLAGLTRS